MPAITCDACGSNSLTMTDDGKFSVCDFCGTKHTLERIKVKVREIKGVVEVTKGEAEKERLLKNADTFVRLNEYELAQKVYKQITIDYPDDYRGYFGLFALTLSYFSNPSAKACSYFTMREFIECYELERKIKILTQQKDITTKLWNRFFKLHENSITVLNSKTSHYCDIVSEIDLFSAELLVYNTNLLPEELKHLQHKLGDIYTEKLRKGEIFPFLIPDPISRESGKICMFRLIYKRRDESAFLNDLWTEGHKIALRVEALPEWKKNKIYKTLGVPEDHHLDFLLGKTMWCFKQGYDRPAYDSKWLESNLIITKQKLDNILDNIF